MFFETNSTAFKLEKGVVADPPWTNPEFGPIFMRWTQIRGGGGGEKRAEGKLAE